jgi:endonuclease/exonuclease/phosphatase family metal-dependent hydrolase
MASDELTFQTFNVRYDTPDDGPHRWDNRKQPVVDCIEETAAHVVGVQEALPHQLAYLREHCASYRWFGVGREDGDAEGEHVPVGIRTDAVSCEDWGTFWLSETPAEPSVGWDGKCPRIATWARLTIEGTDLLFVNTHLDHEGERARVEGAAVLRNQCARLGHDAPVVVTGDFNCTPGSTPYETLVTESALTDFRSAADTVVGPQGTFHGFDDQPRDRIDYVFGSEPFDVTRYQTLRSDGNSVVSDHYPVVATVVPR